MVHIHTALQIQLLAILPLSTFLYGYNKPLDDIVLLSLYTVYKNVTRLTMTTMILFWS